MCDWRSRDHLRRDRQRAVVRLRARQHEALKAPGRLKVPRVFRAQVPGADMTAPAFTAVTATGRFGARGEAADPAQDNRDHRTAFAVAVSCTGGGSLPDPLTAPLRRSRSDASPTCAACGHRDRLVQERSR
jgi:hypothetical protein